MYTKPCFRNKKCWSYLRQMQKHAIASRYTQLYLVKNVERGCCKRLQQNNVLLLSQTIIYFLSNSVIIVEAWCWKCGKEPLFVGHYYFLFHHYSRMCNPSYAFIRAPAQCRYVPVNRLINIVYHARYYHKRKQLLILIYWLRS